MTDIDIEHLKQWEGGEQIEEDVVDAWTARALAAVLDWPSPPEPGDALPPLWHWLYFLPAARQSELGEDGHARRGGFLPPVPLPRRMWASGSVEWPAPLRVGDAARRVSTVRSVTHKKGRSGELVFTVVGHAIHNEAGVAVREEQNLVYRDAPGPDAPPPKVIEPPAAADFGRDMTADPVLLFRYSALTFNGHRIHYDLDFATRVEGYDDLVVHGPLLATLLLDLARHEGGVAEGLARYEYRAVRPLLANRPFKLQGRRTDGGLELWVVDDEGAVAMKAMATLGAES
ncbi:MAG TPA: MaoC family dehydratase N-terminal domain-containing protein [Arenicellales bacterium]|nr:MaoC family dehydratase N-terminal domain-containing protein [Arenicellales bacterium]